MQAGRCWTTDQTRLQLAPISQRRENPFQPSPIHYVQFQSILIISRHDSHHFATALNYYPGEYKYTALAKYRSPFEHTESTHGIESRIIQKIQLQLEEEEFA